MSSSRKGSSAIQTDSEAIIAAALGLPESERLKLISRLMETVRGDELTISVDDPDLVDELNRRFADREGAVPWSELKAES